MGWAEESSLRMCHLSKDLNEERSTEKMGKEQFPAEGMTRGNARPSGQNKQGQNGQKALSAAGAGQRWLGMKLDREGRSFQWPYSW